MQGLRIGSRRCIGVTRRLRGFIAVFIAVGAIAPLACRDTEPPPVLYVDLGDAGRPLPPPVTSPWVDPALKDGRAEWQAFREPRLDTFDQGGPTVTDTDATVQHAEGDGSVESEIRAMLADYNALAAEGKADELLDFYVESQVDAIKTMFDLQSTLVAKMADIEKTLKSKLPDQVDRVSRVFAPMRQANALRLDVGAITSQSDTKASGDVIGSPIPIQITFVVVDDAWYMELPTQLLTLLQASVSTTMPLFDQLKTGLEGGQMPAEQVLASLEQAMAMMSQGLDAATATADGTAEPQSDSTAGSPSDTDTAETTGPSDTAPEPVAPSPAVLQTGAEAFTTANCFKCHGPDGTGTRRGPDLTDDDWVQCDGSVEGILGVLRSGVPEERFVNPDFPFPMQPATKFIQDEETLSALAVYVHEFSQ